MKHEVKAEFVDRETGERFYPADRGAEPVLFEPHDDEQRERLITAGCIGRDEAFDLSTKPVEQMARAELEAATLAIFREQLAGASDDDLRDALEKRRAQIIDDVDEDDDEGDDDLGKLTVEGLKALAEAESVDITSATKKADIIAAIEASRNAA